MMKKITLLLFTICGLFAFSQPYNVTFQVDMNTYPGAIGKMEAFGTFNNFAGGVSIMADANADGVYDITIPLQSGQIEWVYAVDSTSNFEYKTEDMSGAGGSCTLTSGSFTNRVLNVTKDTILPVICWESCVTCTGTPVNAKVTFRVNMTDFDSTYTNVDLSGSFNNWCGGCANMTSVGNDIYELEVNVPRDTIEWKFNTDAWTFQEDLMDGSSCTKTTVDPGGTFVNRVLVVTGDTVLPTVCWGSCADCGAVSIDENWVEDFKVIPNPNAGIFDISGQLTSNETVNISVVDMQGRVIYQSSTTGNSIEKNVDISSSGQGMYILTLTSQNRVMTEKIIYTK